jgi:hypothetical protein
MSHEFLGSTDHEGFWALAEAKRQVSELTSSLEAGIA